MVHRIFLLIAALLIAATAGEAGSIFSANGVGEQLAGGGTRVQGLGAGEIGLADSIGFNSLNPALAALVPRTTFRLGGQVGFWSTTSNGATDADAEFLWKDLGIYVPVTSRYRLGFSAHPTRNMAVLTFEPRRAAFPTDTLEYEARNEWRGSAIELRLDNGYRVSDKLLLGLSAGYTLMHVERIQDVDLPRVGTQPYYFDAEYHQTETYRGWAATLGAHWQMTPALGLGLALRPRFPGNWTYEFARQDADSVLESDRRGDSPGDYRVGLSYMLSPRFVAVGDVSVGQWTNEDLGIQLADSLGSPDPVNPLFVSLGFERQAGRAPLATGFDLWAYRAGLYYRKHYWPERQGAAVEDLGLTAGLSLPVAGGGGWLHVAAETGLRGQDEAKLGATEMYFRTSVQLEISETWFQRSRPRIPQ